MSSPMRITGRAGHVDYRPWMELSQGQLDNLRAAFVDHSGCEGAENGMIVCEWSMVNSDGPPYPLREIVALYRDGEDSEEPRAMFYRTGHRGGVEASIHVPDEATALRFGRLATYLWSDLPAVSASYGELTTYLETVLSDSSAWIPFDINADPLAV